MVQAPTDDVLFLQKALQAHCGCVCHMRVLAAICWFHSDLEQSQVDMALV